MSFRVLNQNLLYKAFTQTSVRKKGLIYTGVDIYKIVKSHPDYYQEGFA
jgi:hypothetical protein